MNRLFIPFILLIALLTSSQQPISFQKKEVTEQMDAVCNWQIASFSYSTGGSPGLLHDYGIDAWTNAVLYIGMAEWAKATNNSTYSDWLYAIGTKNGWRVPANFIQYPRYTIYHADELCIGQFYLNRYQVTGDAQIYASIKSRVDSILHNPPLVGMQAKNKQKWSWCDALFMAPPVYAQLALIENEDKYLAFMHQEFMETYNHLYDKEHKLFFRDDSYFDKEEANGEKVFWGRGNGWVTAGIARILAYLPQVYVHRPFYEALFVEHLNRLIELRDENGFWHASLLDSGSYPSPETSATALIVYAMAYGVNSGLLDKDSYLPLIEKTWFALRSVIDESGKLGYVQPIGADPRKVTKDMSAVYGVGALLLLGSEVYKMNW
ncbi:MAG: glycoside hydrolase family 88/105 protein [Phocaeicola sp.]